MSWTLTALEPALPSPESHLEQSFRTVFTQRLVALGATVRESPGPQGNRLSITFPGATRQWTLEPQVQMGGSRPDFALRSSQGSLPVVAIFTDGWLYHASPAHNRLADDARKRQELRDTGVIVVGITARDVEQARDGTVEPPAWLGNEMIAALMGGSVTFRPRNVEAVRRGPIDFLLSWIQNPDVDGHRGLANLLPLLFYRTARQFSVDATADLAREAARLLLDPAEAPPAGDAGGWWWSAGAVGLLARMSGPEISTALIEVALVIDDRAGKLADKDQAADGWREWLRISNALSLREQPTIITALTEASVQGVPDQAKHGTVQEKGVAFSPGLQSAWNLATGGAERVFLEGLGRRASRESAMGWLAAPVVGLEEDGLPIDFAWPDERIAVCLDLDADTRRDLESARWRVFTGDPDVVFAALREAA